MLSRRKSSAVIPTPNRQWGWDPSDDYLGELFRASGGETSACFRTQRKSCNSNRFIVGNDDFLKVECSDDGDTEDNSEEETEDFTGSKTSLRLKERLGTYLESVNSWSSANLTGRDTTSTTVSPCESKCVTTHSTTTSGTEEDYKDGFTLRPPLFFSRENPPSYAFDAFRGDGASAAQKCDDSPARGIDNNMGCFSGEVDVPPPEEYIAPCRESISPHGQAFSLDAANADVETVVAASLRNRYRSSNNLLSMASSQLSLERHRPLPYVATETSAAGSDSASACCRNCGPQRKEIGRSLASSSASDSVKEPTLIRQIESKWLNSSSFQTSADLWLLSKSIFLVSRFFCVHCNEEGLGKIDSNNIAAKPQLPSSESNLYDVLLADLKWNSFNILHNFGGEYSVGHTAATLLLNSRSLNGITAPTSIAQASFILLAFVFQLQKKESRRKMHSGVASSRGCRDGGPCGDNNNMLSQNTTESCSLPFSCVLNTLAAALTFQSQLHHQSLVSPANNGNTCKSSSSSLYSSCCTMPGFTASPVVPEEPESTRRRSASKTAHAANRSRPDNHHYQNNNTNNYSGTNRPATTASLTTGANSTRDDRMCRTTSQFATSLKDPFDIRRQPPFDNTDGTNDGHSYTTTSLASTSPMIIRPSTAARGSVLKGMCARLFSEVKSGTQKSLQPITSRLSGHRRSDQGPSLATTHRFRSSRKGSDANAIKRIDCGQETPSLALPRSSVASDRLKEQLCQSRDCAAVLAIIQRFCCALFVGSAWVDEQEPLSTIVLSDFLATAYTVLEASRPCCRSAVALGLEDPRRQTGSPATRRRMAGGSRGGNTGSKASQLKRFAAATAFTFYSSVTSSCLQRTSAVDLVRAGGAAGFSGSSKSAATGSGSGGGSSSSPMSSSGAACIIQETTPSAQTIHWSPPHTAAAACVICRDLELFHHVTPSLVSSRLAGPNAQRHHGHHGHVRAVTGRSATSPGAIFPDRESIVRRFGATAVDFERNLFALLASLDYRLQVDNICMRMVSRELLTTFRLASGDSEISSRLSSLRTQENDEAEGDETILFLLDVDGLRDGHSNKVLSLSLIQDVALPLGGDDYSCSTRVPSFPTSSTSLARRSTFDAEEDLVIIPADSQRNRWID